MIDCDIEAQPRGQMAYGSAFFAFRMQWDYEPLEDSVERTTDNKKLWSCHTVLKDSGQKVSRKCICTYW